MNDQCSPLMYLGLLLGATATLAVGAWALSKVGGQETPDELVERLMNRPRSRPTFASVDADWVKRIKWLEGGKTFEWKGEPFGYWAVTEVEEEEEPPTQRFQPRYA